MQYHLILIVLSYLYLFINAQSSNDTTVVPVVHTSTVVEATSVATTAHATEDHTTMVATTIFPTATANISHKVIGPPYVEPPPHPLGYCIRSRLSCSKIRRCCKGPCDVERKKCP